MGSAREANVRPRSARSQAFASEGNSTPDAASLSPYVEATVTSSPKLAAWRTSGHPFSVGNLHSRQY